MARTAVCPWWAGYTLNWGARGLAHPPGRLLGPYLEPGMTALDIGCGMGYFTVPMAGLVGSRGKVIAADLQEKMLVGMAKNAARAGVEPRITPHLCAPDTLGLKAYAGEVDFALAFMMVHEVPDQARLMGEIHAVLRSGGHLLFAEPVGHVGKSAFAKSLAAFEHCGFRRQGAPKIAFCRAALLVK